MTQNLDRIDAPTTPRIRPGRPPEGKKPLWRRPWIVPLFIFSVIYIAITALPYLNRETAPLMPHEGFSLYYPALIAHIGVATIALLTAIFQVWPWLRRTYPAVHRWGGRVYVVTTLIAGALGLIIVPFAPPVGKLGVTIATLLWITFSVIGYIRIRQRRYAEHRRFMLYAFAMVMNNFWGSIIVMVGMQLPFEIDGNYYLEAARWVGWVGNLMAVQWWLYRTAGRPVR
ncbi:DUF2306 domain-containing protein [Micromonospora cathayae]|uniref:DUF2306 domain-containing protein n=1 Tax=Micromonospora cathayae TaxID=3028804 RepID=A0ABY7ZKJ4_9ACTN|nr:DUF2306 domain-containing protein [Micromonospora sp. HUAS 3]WDZ83481.1 DUF2306 domain-containing protein [Micromonospora sp. HUAS 3]